MADQGGEWASPDGTGGVPGGAATPSTTGQPDAEAPPRYGVRVPAAEMPAPAPQFAPPGGPPVPSYADPGSAPTPSYARNAAYQPPPKPGLIPLHPLSFGRLLGAAFATIRWNPRATILPAVVISIAQIAVVAGGGAAIGFSAYNRIASARAADRGAILAGTGAESIVGVLIVAAISLVATALLQGIVVIVVARGALGEKPRAGHVLRRAAKSMRPLIGFALLVGAAELVAFLILAAGVVALALAGRTGVVLAIVLGLVGLLALVALFAWIGVKTAIAPSIIVLERRGVRAAIARSWRLTRQSFWRAFGLIVLVLIILQIATQIVAFPFSIVGTIVAGLLFPNGGTDPASVLTTSLIGAVPSTIVSSVVGGIGSIAQVAAFALLYLDLRMRREGLDLELRAFVESGGAQTGAGRTGTGADGADGSGAATRDPFLPPAP